MSKAAGAGKDNMMDEEMSVAELLVQKAEEILTRKIIDILNEAEDLEDAKETVKALLIK